MTSKTEPSEKEKELKSSCERLQRQVVDLEHDLATVTDRYETSRQDAGSLSQSLQDELASLRSRLSKSEESRSEVQHKLRDLKLTMKANQKQIEGIQGLRNELEVAKNMNNTPHAAETAIQTSNNEEIEQLKKHSQDLQLTLDAKLQECEDLKAKLGKLSEESEAEKREAQILQSKRDQEHQNKSEELQSRLEELQSQLSTAAEQSKICEQLQFNLQEIQKSLRGSKEVNTQLRTEIHELNATKDTLVSSQQKDQQDKALLHQDNHVLQHQISEIQATQDSVLKLKDNETEEQISAVHQQLAEAHSSHSSVLARIESEHKEAVEKLEIQVSELKSEIQCHVESRQNHDAKQSKPNVNPQPESDSMLDSKSHHAKSSDLAHEEDNAVQNRDLALPEDRESENLANLDSLSNKEGLPTIQTVAAVKRTEPELQVRFLRIAL